MKSTQFLPTLAALLVAFTPAFSFGTNFMVLHNFGGPGDGAVVSGPPALDTQGNIYGATTAGGNMTECGDYGCGVIFQLIRQSGAQWSENVLFDFPQDIGRGNQGVILDGLGNIFGSTQPDGGSAPVYELANGGGIWSFIQLYNGGGVDLIIGSGDRLFGVIGPGQHQLGAIGELSPSSDGWEYAQLYSLGGDQNSDGWDPLAPLSLDARGNLYGTMYEGGGIGPPNCMQGSGCGVAFELRRIDTASNMAGLWVYQVIHRFASTPTDGQSPHGSLTLDSQGAAYGTTSEGGAACPPTGCGTVFKLSPIGPTPWSWEETILFDFPADPVCSQGCSPGSNLVFDQVGNLYGVAGGGDLSCPLTCGVVFKLAPQPNGQWDYSVVHYFHGGDGINPLGLAIDAKGDLFGTTQTGGTYDRGVAFEITP